MCRTFIIPHTSSKLTLMSVTVIGSKLSVIAWQAKAAAFFPLIIQYEHLKLIQS